MVDCPCLILSKLLSVLYKLRRLTRGRDKSGQTLRKGSIPVVSLLMRRAAIHQSLSRHEPDDS